VRATGAFWDESANATLVKATYDATGLLFPYVPDVVLRSDTAFFGDLPWTVLRSKMRGRLSLGVTYVDRASSLRAEERRHLHGRRERERGLEDVRAVGGVHEPAR